MLLGSPPSLPPSRAAPGPPAPLSADAEAGTEPSGLSGAEVLRLGWTRRNGFPVSAESSECRCRPAPVRVSARVRALRAGRGPLLGIADDVETFNPYTETPPGLASCWPRAAFTRYLLSFGRVFERTFLPLGRRSRPSFGLSPSRRRSLRAAGGRHGAARSGRAPVRSEGVTFRCAASPVSNGVNCFSCTPIVTFGAAFCARPAWEGRQSRSASFPRGFLFFWFVISLLPDFFARSLHRLQESLFQCVMRRNRACLLQLSKATFLFPHGYIVGHPSAGHISPPGFER